jgi:hypothetical protein
MSKKVLFDREIQSYFKDNDSEIAKFIRQEFNKNNSSSYYNFFDNFLLKYGIISLYSGIVLDTNNKYMPYVNCYKHNIFNEKKGSTYLSKEILNFTTSEKTLAKYLISKLDSLTIKDFEHWNSELYYE